MSPGQVGGDGTSVERSENENNQQLEKAAHYLSVNKNKP